MMTQPDPDGAGTPADVPPEPADERDQGGDPACWAHLVCPECGGVADGSHRPGCRLASGDA